MVRRKDAHVRHLNNKEINKSEEFSENIFFSHFLINATFLLILNDKMTLKN